MQLATTVIIISLIVILILVGGIIFLQIYLSKRDNKVWGLILPIISLFLSFVVILGTVSFAWFTADGIVTVSEISEDGNIIETHVEDNEKPEEYEEFSGANVWIVFYSLFITNIPTVVLLCIYFGCRSGLANKKALEKMSIRDLE